METTKFRQPVFGQRWLRLPDLSGRNGNPRLSSTVEQDKANGDNKDSADAVFLGLKIPYPASNQMFHLSRGLRELGSEMVQHGERASDGTLEVTC